DLDETRRLLGKPTPCVGRELELAQLEGLMKSAIEAGAAKAAVVIAPPGIGKSRLRHELVKRLSGQYPDAVVLVGYGDPSSAGSPYVLSSDALRRHARIQSGEPPDAARAKIAQALGRHVPKQHLVRVSEFLGELAGVPFPADESPPLMAARGD